MKDIRIDVTMRFGPDDPPVVAACYFDPMNPVPLAAYTAYLAAKEPVEGEPDGVGLARKTEALCGLFDAACKHVRVEDTERPKDEISFALKCQAITGLLERWALAGKESGQPSTGI